MNFLIDALKKELAGYERRGLHDRARQVMEQLVLLGCDEFLITLKKSSLVPSEEDTPKKAAVTIVSKVVKKAAPRVIPAETKKPRR